MPTNHGSESNGEIDADEGVDGEDCVRARSDTAGGDIGDPIGPRGLSLAVRGVLTVADLLSSGRGSPPPKPPLPLAPLRTS